MGSPFSGPRYKSWLSDTVIFAAAFFVVLVITAITDILNGQSDPPAYLVGLCGAAGSALFGAVSSDKGKRERDIGATADRAELKADDALGRSDASMNVAFTSVLNVQERELAANRVALQSMKDAVDVKEANGIPVVPETFVSIELLEKQINLLEEDIRHRKLQTSQQHTGEGGHV